MCQSKANGGKRCDHGLNGTRAVKQLITIGLDKTSKEADTLWKAEYLEAKKSETNEPADPKEVKEFVSEQKYKVNGAPDISDHNKKIVITNLNKAEKEKPTRRALRAWKSIMKRVWNKRVMSAAALIGAVSLTTSCATDNNSPQPPQTPTTTIEQPTTSATANPVDSVPTDIEAVPGMKPLNETGFELSEEVYTNSTGTYRKWTASPDSPVRDLFANENIVKIDFDESKTAVAQEAWQDALDFITEETIDSQIAGEISYNDWISSKGTDQREAYKKELSNKWFSSDESLQGVEDSMINVEKSNNIIPGYLDPSSDLGDYSYSDGYPRILAIDVKPIQVSTPPTSDPSINAVRFWVDIQATRKSVINGVTRYVTAPMQLELGLVDSDKDPVDRKWKITEYQVISMDDPIYSEG